MARSSFIDALVTRSPVGSDSGRKIAGERQVRGGSSGFTVVELVVIMTLITVLAAISVPLGLGWISDYRFSAMVRSFPNAVLMARMRGIENRSAITITASESFASAPLTACCPGIKFTTNVSHGLNPSGASGLSCPGSCVATSSCDCGCIKTPSTATAGDIVMISGLDKHVSMNGVEFEVIAAPSGTTFVVQHDWNGLGDVAAADCVVVGTNVSTASVRNLVAPGRLKIFPAVAVTTAPANDNQERFHASDYTVREEGASVVFRYNTDKFQAYVGVGNQIKLLDTTTYKSLQVMFDNRGIPQYVQTQGVSASPVQFSPGFLVKLQENVTIGARQVWYKINASGKVETQASTLTSEQ